MKSGRVLCEVRTEVWYIISINVTTLSGSAMLHVVGSRFFTMENRVRSRVSPFGIRGGLSDTLTGFSPSPPVLPCQYHSTNARHWSLSSRCFYHKKKHAKSGNLQTTNCPLAQSLKREAFAHWPCYFPYDVFPTLFPHIHKSRPIISPIPQSLWWQCCPKSTLSYFLSYKKKHNPPCWFAVCACTHCKF